MDKVVIGIPTFRRPRMLEQALRSVERLETTADVSVLVADNDAAAREGTALVERLRQTGYRFPIAALVVAERGIPQVRNAILEQAFTREQADFLAFMDDDQKVEPAWLDALLAMQEETGADVVGSAVSADFETTPPTWAKQTAAFERGDAASGLVDVVYATNGVLISCRLTTLLPLPWFDPQFALTGGSDSELFQRLRFLGAQFARAKAAVIHEVYPTSRVSLRWVLTRAYRIGNSDVRIDLKLKPRGQVWAVTLSKIAAAFAISPILLILALGRPGRQVDALCKVARAAGKTAALIGSRYDEYARTHGG